MCLQHRPMQQRQVALCLGTVVFAAKLIGFSRAEPLRLPGLQRVDEELESWTKVSVNGRVLELLHGSHLDDLLRDAPDDARPPSLIYFHASGPNAAPASVSLSDFQAMAASGAFGGREQMMLASYDVHLGPKRLWFHMNPERNLTHRFLQPLQRTALPVFVYLPRACNGWTRWCDPGGVVRRVGGDCYVEQCSGWQTIEPDKAGEWVVTSLRLRDSEQRPAVMPSLDGTLEQRQWLRSRDTATTKEHMLALQQPRSLPRFTRMGFKVVPIPHELNELMVAFYKQNINSSYDEDWSVWGQTQVNAHESVTEIISIQGPEHRSLYFDRIVEIMQPRLEDWVGLPLEFTSLYGIREYHSPASLRMHLDRPDWLVVSATFSVHQEGFNHSDWPLEVTSYDGFQYRLEHPAGSVMYYESSTLAHGKPTRLPPGGKHAGLFLHFRPLFWTGMKYTDLVNMRLGKSACVEDSGAEIHHHKQEHWGDAYMVHGLGDSDLQEGTRFVVGNICKDAADQRNDSGVDSTFDSHTAKALAAGLAETLREACKEAAGPVDKVRRLLRWRADIDAADSNGWRPIHEAARAGNLDVLQLLVEHNASIAAKTHSGHSALDLASHAHGAGSAPAALVVKLLAKSAMPQRHTEEHEL